MAKLNVFADGVLVGELCQSASELSFRYAESWLKSEKSFALSPHLPLSGEINPGSVYTFFLNILPEEATLSYAAARLGVRKDDVFGLLRKIGRDCPGALSVVDGWAPEAGGYQPLTVPELREALYHDRLFTLCGRSKMSLAGAQDKLGVFLGPEDTLHLPIGLAPSTHIIKARCSEEYPHCVTNELIIMMLARKLGLSVPDTSLLRIPEPVFVVKRFDRIAEDGEIRRVHQIDACQFFNVPNTSKYEHAYEWQIGGLTLKHCFDMVRATQNPVNAVSQVCRWVLFNYLVGNTDAHAKNIALLVYPKERMELAPFYDLLSTEVYGYDSHMAFDIGGESDINRIGSICWQDMCTECGIKYPFLQKIMRGLAGKVLGTFDSLGYGKKYSWTKDELNFINTIRSVIEKNKDYLLQACS